MPFKSAIAKIADLREGPSKRNTGGQTQRPRSPSVAAEGVRQTNLTVDLCRFIEAANTWQNLEGILDAVDAALQQRKLDVPSALDLCHLILSRCSHITDLRVKAHSKLLNETVLIAADDAEIGTDNNVGVYRASEMQLLVEKTPEELQAAHVIKKEFEGEIIEPDAEGIQIHLESLLDRTRDVDICHACRQSNWRSKGSGQRVCAVCHPAPIQQNRKVVER